MTREIKFRAWDVEHKRWLIKSELEDVGHYRYGEVVPNELVLQDERNEKILLSQFTGLKDKNGKEIYEGDVVRWYNGEIGEILFHFPDGTNNIYGFVFHSSQSWYGLNKMEIDGEIIGNIYENPELIKPL